MTYLKIFKIVISGINKISILFIFIFCLQFSLYAHSKLSFVHIEGVLKNFQNEIKIEDMSEVGDLQFQNLQRTVLPDSNGFFSISFELTHANYFRIGRNILFLHPKDSLKVFLDYRDPINAKFEGRHSEENEYLKYTPFPKGGSFLNSGDNVKRTLQETIDTIIYLGGERKRSLLNYNNLSNEFKAFEIARTNFDIINSFINTEFYFPYINKLGEKERNEFVSEYKKNINFYILKYFYNLDNPNFLRLTVFRDILPKIYELIPAIKNSVKINDWINAKKIFQTASRQNNKIELSSIRNKAKGISTSAYKKMVLEAIDKRLKFNDGDNAKDFTMLDTFRKGINLNYFKGKVIYLDLWATWCGPCINELPYLDSLKEKYYENNDIVFISLSIDDDLIKWQKFINKKKLKGEQFIIDRVKLESYYVNQIPRVIIIDKLFKVAALYGYLPSSNKLQPFLNSLLN